MSACVRLCPRRACSTTTKYQTQIAQDIFTRLDKQGNLTRHSMDQLWCTVCQRYVSDRFVKGTCYECGAKDARGDQCESVSRQRPSTLRIRTWTHPPTPPLPRVRLRFAARSASVLWTRTSSRTLVAPCAIRARSWRSARASTCS